MASYTKLQRLSRSYVLLVAVNVLLQQLLHLLLLLHDRHDVALQTRYQQHDLVDDVFAMTQLRLHPSDARLLRLRFALSALTISSTSLVSESASSNSPSMSASQ